MSDLSLPKESFITSIIIQLTLFFRYLIFHEILPELRRIPENCRMTVYFGLVKLSSKFEDNLSSSSLPRVRAGAPSSRIERKKTKNMHMPG